MGRFETMGPDASRLVRAVPASMLSAVTECFWGAALSWEPAQVGKSKVATHLVTRLMALPVKTVEVAPPVAHGHQSPRGACAWVLAVGLSETQVPREVARIRRASGRQVSPNVVCSVRQRLSLTTSVLQLRPPDLARLDVLGPERG